MTRLRFYTTPFLTLSFSVLAMLGLSSCGGSDSNSPETPPETQEIKVTEIIVPTPRFSQTIKVTVNGRGLDQQISVLAPFCSSLTENTGGSATITAWSIQPAAVPLKSSAAATVCLNKQSLSHSRK